MTRRSKQRNFKKKLPFIFIAGMALLVVLQINPFGRDHANPAVKSEPQWDSLQTKQLA
jgi:hypothetical protein